MTKEVPLRPFLLSLRAPSLSVILPQFPFVILTLTLSVTKRKGKNLAQGKLRVAISVGQGIAQLRLRVL